MTPARIAELCAPHSSSCSCCEFPERYEHTCDCCQQPLASPAEFAALVAERDRYRADLLACKNMSRHAETDTPANQAALFKMIYARAHAALSDGNV